ncbi:hypothetical protein NBRC116188_07240 [Oceaniserpentilla sp. 4NH20-0058]
MTTHSLTINPQPNKSFTQENHTCNPRLQRIVLQEQALDKFYNHPLAKQDIQWGSPPSKQIDYKVRRPVFFEEGKNHKPHMLFIDQFCGFRGGDSKPRLVTWARYFF